MHGDSRLRVFHVPAVGDPSCDHWWFCWPKVVKPKYAAFPEARNGFGERFLFDCEEYCRIPESQACCLAQMLRREVLNNWCAWQVMLNRVSVVMHKLPQAPRMRRSNSGNAV